MVVILSDSLLEGIFPVSWFLLRSLWHEKFISDESSLVVNLTLWISAQINWVADEFNFIWYRRIIMQNFTDINTIKRLAKQKHFNWTEKFLDEVCLQVKKAWYCAQIRNCSLQVAVPKTPAGSMKYYTM